MSLPSNDPAVDAERAEWQRHVDGLESTVSKLQTENSQLRAALREAQETAIFALGDTLRGNNR